MKKVTLLLISLKIFSVYSQSVKEQIGTSIWLRNGKVFADSTVAYVISYDRQHHRIREWQVYRDTSGIITDTNYVDLDSAGNVLHSYAGKSHYYFEYNIHGSLIRTIAYLKNDTIDFTAIPLYDHKGRLSSYSNGIQTYKYRGRTTFEYIRGKLSRKERRNRNKNIVYGKYINEASTEILRFKRNRNEEVNVYTKKNNGKLVKRTNHIYKDGVEVSQIEEFFKPSYLIETVFKYEYW